LLLTTGCLDHHVSEGKVLGPWPKKVSELVDVDTGQWDRTKLSFWFERHTCEDILRVPLTNTAASDVLIWSENKSNRFTVKSAYGVAQRLLNPTLGNHSMAGVIGRFWKSVWKLNTPPKVRNFLWRACSNILPTRDNLHRKKLQVEPWCAICHQPIETVCHILWECPLARNVWTLVKGRTQKSAAQASDFLALTRSMVERLPKEEMERRSAIAWAIWNARNKLCFENFQTLPEIILRGAISFLHEYQELVAQQRTV